MGFWLRILRSTTALMLSALCCGPAAAADLVVLTADQWCPHTCDPASGQDGYMIDIAREAFALSGYKTEYRFRPWATAVSDVRAGIADGAVGTLATEAPDLVSGILPLGLQSNAVAILTGDSFKFHDLDSLTARSIGIVRDYSYSLRIDAWLTDHPQYVSAQGGNHAAAANLRRMLDGQIDTVLDDEAVLRHTIARSGLGEKIQVVGRLTGGDLHIAFTQARRRGDFLAPILDRGIETLRRSGRLSEILAGYGLSDWEQ